ncbi:ras-related protein Rab-13-like [Lytechinus variegatus]|uniref:ras-related protein Rab-13-like n=1 Tax=Lytechinus variegatus TaxID=7654 RepID=UPI001BB1F0EA|nr:ras-related protein Rab-13-like [Lytechinus variegatus]
MAFTFDDLLLSAILIGDVATGKSSIVTRCSGENFDDKPIVTTGVDFSIAKLTLGEATKVRLQLWDTTGQERYHAITTQYYRRAMGVVLVYDVTRKDSFEHLKEVWIPMAIENADPEAVWMLLGNKVDLADWREVSIETGHELAVCLGCPYLEVSARENHLVFDAFRILANQILKYTYPKLNPCVSPNAKTIKLKKEHDKPSCCR